MMLFTTETQYSGDAIGLEERDGVVWLSACDKGEAPLSVADVETIVRELTSFLARKANATAEKNLAQVDAKLDKIMRGSALVAKAREDGLGHTRVQIELSEPLHPDAFGGEDFPSGGPLCRTCDDTHQVDGGHGGTDWCHDCPVRCSQCDHPPYLAPDAVCRCACHMPRENR